MNTLKPNMVYLAVYKGPGNFFDWLIRKRSKSAYSHCEIFLDGVAMSTQWGECVRTARIMDAAHWDFFEVPSVLSSQIYDHYWRTRGMRYDYVGAVLGLGLSLRVESKHRYHCAEWCSAALGLSTGYNTFPQDVVNDLAKLGASTTPIEMSLKY
jgi:hypothetical protein